MTESISERTLRVVADLLVEMRIAKICDISTAADLEKHFGSDGFNLVVLAEDISKEFSGDMPELHFEYDELSKWGNRSRHHRFCPRTRARPERFELEVLFSL